MKKNVFMRAINWWWSVFGPRSNVFPPAIAGFLAGCHLYVLLALMMLALCH